MPALILHQHHAVGSNSRLGHFGFNSYSNACELRLAACRTPIPHRPLLIAPLGFRFRRPRRRRHTFRVSTLSVRSLIRLRHGTIVFIMRYRTLVCVSNHTSTRGRFGFIPLFVASTHARVSQFTRLRSAMSDLLLKFPLPWSKHDTSLYLSPADLAHNAMVDALEHWRGIVTAYDAQVKQLTATVELKTKEVRAAHAQAQEAKRAAAAARQRDEDEGKEDEDEDGALAKQGRSRTSNKKRKRDEHHARDVAVSGVKCVVCWEAQVQLLLNGCGHVALCNECHAGMRRAAGPAATIKCPVCRKDTAQVTAHRVPGVSKTADTDMPDVLMIESSRLSCLSTSRVVAALLVLPITRHSWHFSGVGAGQRR